MANNGVLPLSTVHIVGRLLGGGKKRKKKVFTTPKKTAHEKTKVKLPSLSTYSVGDDGSIVRTRRECPSPQCGAGVFMANHGDRQTCGKCGLTYMFETKETEEELQSINMDSEQIFVQTLSGETLVLNLDLNEVTVNMLQDVLEHKQGLTADHYR